MAIGETHAVSGVEEAAAALVARLRQVGVVPVVELPRAEDAVPLAGALIAGGLSCVEITLRTPGAVEGIAAIRAAYPEILLGAGTVLSIAQLETAIAAGADFAVAPGTNPEIVRASLERGLPILPGVSTPSEVETAMALGLRTVKLFPAELLGGAPYVRALCGPYREIGFVPTGSITPETLPGYLEIAQVHACGGSWMVKPAVIAAGDFAAIEQLASDAVRLVSASR
jgi:2-dehydro-3-deoxyphosphogluconate aldolase/(4S)-4-hydroxy-2-oxoglutarate aldolase